MFGKATTDHVPRTCHRELSRNTGRQNANFSRISLVRHVNSQVKFFYYHDNGRLLWRPTKFRFQQYSGVIQSTLWLRSIKEKLKKSRNSWRMVVVVLLVQKAVLVLDSIRRRLYFLTCITAWNWHMMSSIWSYSWAYMLLRTVSQLESKEPRALNATLITSQCLSARKCFCTFTDWMTYDFYG